MDARCATVAQLRFSACFHRGHVNRLGPLRKTASQILWKEIMTAEVVALSHIMSGGGGWWGEERERERAHCNNRQEVHIRVALNGGDGFIMNKGKTMIIINRPGGGGGGFGGGSAGERLMSDASLGRLLLMCHQRLRQ